MGVRDREVIGQWSVTDYVYEAANAFTKAALDDIRWGGDTEGTNPNPLDLGAYAWRPVTYRDLDTAWDDAADSPERQVENALDNDRVVEIVELLALDPWTFGGQLYYDQNGHGTGFWSLGAFEYRELSDLIGYHPWGVEYSFDPDDRPHVTDYVTLRVVSG